MQVFASLTLALALLGSVVANSVVPIGQQGPSVPVVVGEPVDSLGHSVGHINDGHVHDPSHNHHHFYSPSGVIQVIGGEQFNSAPAPVSAPVVPLVGAGPKPVRSVEQYGQPEPTALPPNYKPFGSWGLYIGGNPADGYYSNYYKSLAGDKPASSAADVPAPVAPKPALSSVLRQASAAPVEYSSYYNQADLNSGSAPQYISPVQAGAQVYGAPSIYDSFPLSYADAYSTKKIGSSYVPQRELGSTKQLSQQQEVVSPVQSGKGQRGYSYQTVVGQLVAPGVAGQVVQQPGQVVAYPVPVGSQIVGSQPGVDGAFYPHGVHAFTRYAVKPTVVSGQDQVYQYGVYGSPSSPQVVPVVQNTPVGYKQQLYSAFGTQAGAYPLSYYGYPLSQLHYSANSVGSPASYSPVVPSSVVSGSAAAPSDVGSSVVSSDKVESDEKIKPQ